MERQNGFLIGLTGLAAGIAVGLLLAPKSGRDLRKDIRRTARHLPGDLQEAAEDLRDEVEHKAHDLRTAAGDLADDVKRTVKKVSNEVYNNLPNIKR